MPVLTAENEWYFELVGIATKGFVPGIVAVLLEFAGDRVVE